MARSVREALASILAPDKARLVLDVALMLDQRGLVPEEAERARDFVQGALARSLDTQVGEDASELVLATLEPILECAGSHVRARARKDESGIRHAETLPPDALPAPMQRHVFVSSLDRTGIQGLARQLVQRAKVRQVAHVFDLLSAVEAHYVTEPVIIIDCALPAVDPATLANMLPIQFDEVRVILWGATAAMRTELAKKMPMAKHWVPCPGSTSHEELAMLVEKLLDER